MINVINIKENRKKEGFIMIVKPSVADLLKKSKNRFELVIATSKRARKIAQGDEPLVVTKEEAPVTIAAEEIAEGKVKIC
jgi:DNA-directed RNA polymerase subunit omega